MAEEENKPHDTKQDEPKKTDQVDDNKEAEKPADAEDKKVEDSKEKQESVPQEIVLHVFMHCEGCARKVRRCLKGFEGVESVETDCKTHKVVVKGDKADPLKVVERVQRKSHRQVHLISPIPNPPVPLDNKPEPIIHNPKAEDNKLEIITVVLKVHMHCEACAQEIKRRIHKMKGVEWVDPDLKNSEVKVKGAIDPPTLVEYVYKRTGKHAVILKQEPEKIKEEAPKEEEKADGDGGQTVIIKGDVGESEKKVEEESKEEKAGGVVGEGGGEGEVKAAEGTTEEVTKVVEMEVKKNEYYYNPQRYIMEMYAYPPQMVVGEGYAPPPQILGMGYPPQMFSDENPNACCVM